MTKVFTKNMTKVITKNTKKTFSKTSIKAFTISLLFLFSSIGAHGRRGQLDVHGRQPVRPGLQPAAPDQQLQRPEPGHKLAVACPFHAILLVGV
jgi:hypothetical protein